MSLLQKSAITKYIALTTNHLKPITQHVLSQIIFEFNFNEHLFQINLIDDFQVTFRVCLKASPGAKPFIWIFVLFT